MRQDTTVTTDRPDENRSVLRWLLPLLVLLLLGIGFFYFLMGRKDNGTSADNAPASTQPASTQTQNTISNLATLLSNPDPSSLVGKKVALSGAVVDQVIGDKSFTLGSSADHVYALLSDQLNTGQTEQAVQVKAGETRSVQGTVVKTPSDTSTLMTQFQLSQQQAAELKNQGFYISVSQTSVVGSNDASGGDMPTGAGTE